MKAFRAGSTHCFWLASNADAAAKTIASYAFGAFLNRVSGDGVASGEYEVTDNNGNPIRSNLRVERVN